MLRTVEQSTMRKVYLRLLPFAILSSQDVKHGMCKPVRYNEPSAKRTGVVVPEAWTIMERFIRGETLIL